MKTDPQRILQALSEARIKLENEKNRRHEPIAIIGMACRFPGDSNTPQQYWNMLCSGIDTISHYPQSRFDPPYDANLGLEGSFLDNIDQFDPQFFGISPKEANEIDPQQRLLLETSWEALENAGEISGRLDNNNTGVFIGITLNDYSRLTGPAGISPHYVSANNLNAAAGRISYVLGLSGPSMAIDTACSSSLVAVHQAIQSLRNRECDMAIAGGVNLILSSEVSDAGIKANILSSDGRCKTFDASANGIGRGEGCGTVVLKRFSDALADRDNIVSVIRSSAINSDGPSSGFMVPNGNAQQRLIQNALQNAQLKPEDISYIEAHGTGTSLGDPIEIGALREVFAQGRDHENNPLLIGSVKSNIGHLESAAGIAGLIKLVLCLQAGKIPGNLHLNKPNPYIDWCDGALMPVTSLHEWSTDDKLIAGISSFGASGTNAHLIVEQASPDNNSEENPLRSVQILTLSAQSDSALKKLAQEYAYKLDKKPVNFFSDACYTANTGRKHCQYRLALIADTSQQAVDLINDFILEKSNTGYYRNKTSTNDFDNPVFLFTGQGSQYLNMGYQLYQSEPVFKTTMDQCEKILSDDLEYPLLDIIYPELNPDNIVNNDELIHQTQYAQPALFALEYALSQLWKSWGITPSAVMGHSVGEYVAACVAGVFSLEEGLKSITKRARLMQDLPDDGAMLVVMENLETVNNAIAPHKDQINIAAVNGEKNIVISGYKSTISDLEQQFKSQGTTTLPLSVSHAFHSPLMSPMVDEFRLVVEGINYQKPYLPIYSNLNGQLAESEIQSADYWCKHILEPVQFSTGMESLKQQGYKLFLEIGPRPTLVGMGKDCINGDQSRWLSSLRQNVVDHQYILSSLATLYTFGAKINWHNFHKPFAGKKCLLPTYPFQRERCWKEFNQDPVAQKQGKMQLRHGYALAQSANHPKEYIWEEKINAESASYLFDHRLEGVIAIPGGMFIELIYTALDTFFDASNFTLGPVDYTQMLFLPEGVTQTVQVILTEKNNQEISFDIFSRASDSDSKSWIKNGMGKANPSLAREA